MGAQPNPNLGMSIAVIGAVRGGKLLEFSDAEFMETPFRFSKEQFVFAYTF